MEKMKMESVDMTEQNIEKIEALFPSCITEAVDADGKMRKAINFNILRQMLSADVVDGNEAYEFTWVGKKAAIVEANKPTRKTLRPFPEESVNWDTTENLYIEGDNLDVLKLLQESYLGAVKMIYIDPPYNTGNDFIYKDDYRVSEEEYEDGLGIYDEDGGQLFKNTDANGRFHSDWCSMIYSRLLLARSLMKEGGFILISIDENEEANLKEIGAEVFGRSNYIGTFIWHRRQMPDSRNQSHYSMDHEYVLCYAKGQSVMKGKDIDQNKYQNPDNDPRGPWFSADLTGLADREHRPNLHYNVINPDTGRVYPPNPTRGWSCSKDTMEKLIAENKILWPSKSDGRPRRKKFLQEVTQLTTSVSSMLDVGYTTEGTRILKNLFGGKEFDFPKPVSLIKFFINQCTEENDIILDFFSGSATTAQAVFESNVEDFAKRRFILVQLPEIVEGAEYKTVCELGKERIRRSGAIIQNEAKKSIDYGFRVLKLDDTNMRDVYYSADEYSQDMLPGLESNIKEDRTDLDLLFGCLLEWGLPLSLPYTSETIDGCTVHTYNKGDLIACFDENISKNVVETIAKRQPLRAVFRDNSFPNSPAKINVGEIFKLFAPDTRIKVL